MQFLMKKEQTGHTEIALQISHWWQSTFMHPKSPLCPLEENFQPIFSYFGKVFGTRTRVVMPWLRNASCLLTQFVLLLGDSTAGLFLTGPGSEMACGLDTLWCQLIPLLLIYIYFGAAGVTGQKEKHMLRECTHSFSQRHTGSLQGWVQRGRLQRVLLMWKQVFRGQQKSSWSPTIHLRSWTGCKSELNPKSFSQLYVLQTGEGGAESVLLLSDSRRASVPEQSRAVQIKPPDSFNVFFILSPHPGVACSDLHSPRLPAKDTRHMYTLTHTRTLILMLTHSWFIANICEMTRIIQSAPLQHSKVNSSQWNR